MTSNTENSSVDDSGRNLSPGQQNNVFEGVLNLQEAVAVVIESTQKAASVLRSSYVKLNGYKAALFSPSELPADPVGRNDPSFDKGNDDTTMVLSPPHENLKDPNLTTEDTTTAGTESTSGKAEKGAREGEMNLLLKCKPKLHSTEVETGEAVVSRNIIITYLKEYSENVTRETQGSDGASCAFSYIVEGLDTDAAQWKRNAKHHFIWCVDALNGSVNFVHGLPDVAISVSLLYVGQDRVEALIALVFCPFIISGVAPPSTTFLVNTKSVSEEGYIHGELFTAVKGMGVFLNGRRFSANSKAASVQKSLMFWNAPSFISVPCDNYEEKFNQCIDCWAQLRRTCCQPPFTVSTVRIGNSIMTTLAQLAVGRVDLCVETCCHLAHIVSAILLMEESGGIATDLYGNKIDISKLLSSNEEGSPKMTTLIAGANREVVQFAADLCKKENYGAFWNM